MKIRTVFLLAIAGLFVGAPVHAVGDHQFGVEVGASLPSTGFSDYAHAGYNLGAQYQYLHGRLGAGTEVKFHSWSATEERNQAAGPDAKYRFASWQYDVYGILTLPMQSAQPYLKLGAGYYAPNTKLERPAGNVRQYDVSFGGLAGFGIDFATRSSMKIGVAATYHQIKDTDRDFVSVSARVIWPFSTALPSL